MGGLTSFLVKWFVCAVSLAVASWMIKGITIQSGWALIISALIIGCLNAVLRPILLILTLPINILTLGLFTFVINALLLLLVAKMVDGLVIDGFWTAFFASMLMSIVSLILNLMIVE